MGLVSYLDQLGLVFEFTLGFVSGMFIFFLSYFPGFSIKVSDGIFCIQTIRLLLLSIKDYSTVQRALCAGYNLYFPFDWEGFILCTLLICFCTTQKLYSSECMFYSNFIYLSVFFIFLEEIPRHILIPLHGDQNVLYDSQIWMHADQSKNVQYHEPHGILLSEVMDVT